MSIALSLKVARGRAKFPFSAPFGVERTSQLAPTGADLRVLGRARVRGSRPAS